MNKETLPGLTISSKYIENSSVFYRNKKAPLLVLVEDKEDIPFWSKMFACICDGYSRIDVWSLQEASVNALEQRDAQGNCLTATGKDALMKVIGLGKHKVLAVDADYDLLLDYHKYSNRVRTDKYVIHTEYYSIENHLLTALNIPNLSLWNSVKAHLLSIDWKFVLNTFGESVLEAVKLSLVSVGRREKAYKQDSKSKTLPDVVKVSDINESFGSVDFSHDAYIKKLDQCKRKFESATSKLREECQKELSEYNDWSSEDALYHIQGHTLYNFVSKVIKYYFEDAFKKLEKEEKEKVIEKAKIPDVIKNLKSDIGIAESRADFIKNSIYNADAIDMKDDAVVKIQNNIGEILK